MRVHCVLVLGIVAGCTRTEEKGAATVDASPPTTRASSSAAAADPASAPCPAAPCRGYDRAAADVQALARSGGYCLEASAGKCALGRYVLFNDGFGGYTEFFDEAGVMKGSHRWADYAIKGTDYGVVPICEKLPTQIWCKNGARDASTD